MDFTLSQKIQKVTSCNSRKMSPTTSKSNFIHNGSSLLPKYRFISSWRVVAITGAEPKHKNYNQRSLQILLRVTTLVMRGYWNGEVDLAFLISLRTSLSSWNPFIETLKHSNIAARTHEQYMHLEPVHREDWHIPCGTRNPELITLINCIRETFLACEERLKKNIIHLDGKFSFNFT